MRPREFHHVREQIVPQVSFKHSERPNSHRVEGPSCTRAGRRCDSYNLDSAGPSRSNRRQQVRVAGHEQMDIGALPGRSCGLKHHLDSEIHIGLLLGLESDVCPAACALAHFLFVGSATDLQTGAVLQQRLEVDVLAAGRPRRPRSPTVEDAEPDVPGWSTQARSKMSARAVLRG